jgi:hypothetical protein
VWIRSRSNFNFLVSAAQPRDRPLAIRAEAVDPVRALRDE